MLLDVLAAGSIGLVSNLTSCLLISGFWGADFANFLLLGFRLVQLSDLLETVSSNSDLDLVVVSGLSSGGGRARARDRVVGPEYGSLFDLLAAQDSGLYLSGCLHARDGLAIFGSLSPFCLPYERVIGNRCNGK